MSSKPRRAILIGIDGGTLHLVDKLVRAGKMPHVAQLMSQGSVAEAYPQVPCDTPTNWTTLATGATSGTHGITGFYLHLPGEELHLGQVLRDRSFLSTYCQAEYIWDVADRVGKKSLVINYPPGWPATLDDGAMVFGTGVPVHAVGGPARYIAGGGGDEIGADYAGIDTIQIALEALEKESHPRDWEQPVLGATLPLISSHVQEGAELKLFLLQGAGGEYDHVVITTPGEPMDDGRVLRVGEWSDWYKASFTLKPDSDGVWMRGWIGPARAETRTHKSYCRFHISSLSPDGADLVLERTHLFTTYEWTHPPELGDVLLTQLDLGITSDSVARQVQRLGAEALVAEYAWLNDYRLQAKRLARIIDYLQENGGWDLCYLHFHLMDSVNHRFLTFLAPEFPGYSVDQAEAAMRQYEEAYTIVDDFTGDLLERCVDDQTLVIFVSDHAAVPTWRFTNVASPLIQAGLLAYRWTPERERYEVDWSKTKAYPYVTPPFIWVNLKGRDPQGTVEPDDYEAVRRQIIDALLDWRDKLTDCRPVLAALPREDAAIVGLVGDRVGDIVYFLNPQYQPWDGDITHEWPYFLTPDRFEEGDVRESRKVFGTHDHVSPTAQVGPLTVKSILIMSGPGIRRGFRATNPVPLIDVAPTISHLLGIPTPAQSEGAVLSSFLAD